MLASTLALSLLAAGLRWDAPAEACPSAEQMRARIEAAGGQGDLEVSATVREDEGTWVLTLSIGLGEVTDTRELRASDCEALAESTVLLVATRLDEVEEGREAPLVPPPAVEAEPQLEPRSEEPAPRAEEAPRPGEVGPEPEPPQRSEDATRPVETRAVALPTGVVFGFAAGVGLGSVPAPGVPIELGIDHAWPRLRVGVRGRFHGSPESAVDEARSMRVLLGTGGVRACARPSLRRLEFPVCGELGLGGSRAALRGPARDRGGLWAEAAVGAGLAWFLATRWALTARLQGAVPLLGSAYTFEGEEIWSPSVVTGRVSLGVEFVLPIRKRSRPEK